MTFTEGNKQDGKHYWLTPDDLMAEINAEFDITFDPAPYPRPEGFDGLKVEWGESNYVNPPFGSYLEGKKKIGPTAWVRKAIEEYQKGKRVVLVYPLDGWVHLLLNAGAKFRTIGKVLWKATEDETLGGYAGRPIAMFILDPNKDTNG